MLKDVHGKDKNRIFTEIIQKVWSVNIYVRFDISVTYSKTQNNQNSVNTQNVTQRNTQKSVNEAGGSEECVFLITASQTCEISV